MLDLWEAHGPLGVFVAMNLCGWLWTFRRLLRHEAKCSDDKSNLTTTLARLTLEVESFANSSKTLLSTVEALVDDLGAMKTDAAFERGRQAEREEAARRKR